MEVGVRAKGVTEKEHVDEAHRITRASLQAPLTAGTVLASEMKRGWSRHHQLLSATPSIHGRQERRRLGDFCAKGEALAPGGWCSCHQDE